MLRETSRDFLHMRLRLVTTSFLLALAGIVPMVSARAVSEQLLSDAIVFIEPSFPTADSAEVSPSQLAHLFPGAAPAGLERLHDALASRQAHVLILPYGSAFPEAAWPDVAEYLQRGGNLLVIGGKPFTRAAFRDASGWHLRDYSVRFARQLMIDQYETTPGSDGLEFLANPDLPVKVPRFGWTRGFSPVIRLSAVDLYHRGGSAGSIDARVDPLAWGTKDGRKLSAPGIVIDHLRNGYDGGRWVFLNAELPSEFLQRAAIPSFLASLIQLASRGSQEFSVRPTVPLYLPGEPIPLEVLWHSANAAPEKLTLKITTYADARSSSRVETQQTFPLAQQLILPAPSGKGLYFIDAELLSKEAAVAVYHSGFWVRDEDFLRSGPRLSVNHDYFELDGHPLAVVGTTYMSGEVQRLYFEHPNVAMWDRDLAQISAAGVNMLRTGWWTGWDKFCDENGQPYDRTLRTIEAFLMTSRRHQLPVQFNFFAFLPEVLGGANPYLDAEAVQRQQTLVSAIAARFHDLPYLAWDLINEPSFSQHLWTMRPNGDAIELARWNQWLSQRYADRAALAAAWNLPLGSLRGTIPLPAESEFTPRGMYTGHNSLKLYDYFLFAQESFANWVRGMREAIRAAGSQQLITVGQDEGGFQDRLSPAFFGPYVDFTTNHSWWANDSLLWDSLVAKQPGMAMLLQETGLQRELTLDEIARRTPENEAALLERKLALSFVSGSGAIEWLWNTNSYMTESNETPIGAIRPDGTEKPEATLIRNFAGFAKSLEGHLRNPQRASVAIVTSQAGQFSVLSGMQIEAQQKSVRALAYYDHVTPWIITENQINKMGSPKLAILPSPQALTDVAWQSLLTYVSDGGVLLITGSVDRNEHWQVKPRAPDLHVDARSEPLVVHNAGLPRKDRTIPLTFDQQKQMWLNSVRFANGSTLAEIPLGKGLVFWAAYPVELAEGPQATADLYSYVLARAGIEPLFALESPVSSGILVSATPLDDSVLYLFASEDASDAKINLLDKRTGARIRFTLASQHAAVAVVSLKEKTVVARYNF